MESRIIRDDQLTESSYFIDSHGDYTAKRGRLNESPLYWSTAVSNPDDPWIQVDLLQQTIVIGIITQGAITSNPQWITELQVQYGKSVDTLIYIHDNGNPMVSTLTHGLL